MTKNDKIKSLLVIGNGFDLAHGLRTSYIDFFEFYITKGISQSRYPDGFDTGPLINQFSENKIEFTDAVENNFWLKIINCLKDKDQNKWSDLEYLIGEILIYITKRYRHSIEESYVVKMDSNFRRIKSSFSETLGRNYVRAEEIESLLKKIKSQFALRG